MKVRAAAISGDTKLVAFGLRIYPTGRKSFVVSYWSRGRRRFFTLGQYGKMTLHQAREAALESETSPAPTLPS